MGVLWIPMQQVCMFRSYWTMSCIHARRRMHALTSDEFVCEEVRARYEAGTMRSACHFRAESDSLMCACTYASGRSRTGSYYGQGHLRLFIVTSVVSFTCMYIYYYSQPVCRRRVSCVKLSVSPSVHVLQLSYRFVCRDVAVSHVHVFCWPCRT